jgi:hypothetical protein
MSCPVIVYSNPVDAAPVALDVDKSVVHGNLLTFFFFRSHMKLVRNRNAPVSNNAVTFSES